MGSLHVCKCLGDDANPGPSFQIDRWLTPEDFRTSCYVVGMSGDGKNKWGHVALEVKGFTFQVARPGTHFPQWMTRIDFQDFLAAHGKSLWWRVRIDDITEPEKAFDELKARLRKPYTWGVTFHNCSSFAEYVVEAGGTKFRIPRHWGTTSLPGALAVYGPVGRFDP